ncbi:MAG: hypothetical protein CME40_03110 [Haliea sp.]|nr:hypothetical protein [Haliea sp.]|tara:strand:+ start:169567 stop:169794 length:228 start_codon:yes stop_codon:yes gene_type:complete
MKNREDMEAENRATLDLFGFIEDEFGQLPVRVVAGALMRASIALAVEVFGADLGAKAARHTLENILSQRQQRKLQ